MPTMRFFLIAFSRHNSYRLLALCLVIFYSPYLLKGQIEPINQKEDWEFWFNNVPVSGEVKVGFMTEFSNDELNPKSFFVNIPKNLKDIEEKFLCTEISSKDGRYEANLKYKIIDLKGGENEFSWPTKYSKDLSNFKKEDVAILSYIGKSCRKRKDIIYIPSSWSQKSEADSLFLFLKTKRLTILKVVQENGQVTSEYNCWPLEKRFQVAYDCLCKVPIKDLQGLQEESYMKIVQKTNRGRITNFKKIDFNFKL